MINRVVLVGRLTKDPILKSVPSGDYVGEFTLALNRKFGSDQADFIKCIVWRKVAENVNKYCSKGSVVGIEGKLQSRSYENSQGHKVYVVEVVCDSVSFINTKKTAGTSEQLNNAGGLDNPDDSSIYYDIQEEDIQF